MPTAGAIYSKKKKIMNLKRKVCDEIRTIMNKHEINPISNIKYMKPKKEGSIETISNLKNEKKNKK